MTKSWKKHHWLIAILLVCLLILVLFGGSGLADGIRIVLVGILHLLGQIITQLVALAGQLVSKIGK